jgi:hypothetical protein
MDPLAIHAFAPERREQSRVGIDDPPAIGCDHRRGDQLEVPSQHHEIDPVLLQNLEPRACVRWLCQDVGRYVS